MRAAIAEIQHLSTSDELPIESLTVDPGVSPSRTISSEEAVEDVLHLFRILEDGWCGYGTFKGQGDFMAAQDAIIQRLEGRSRWSTGDFAKLLREELSFVHDCHLKIGGIQYCDHLDFWYDETLSFWPADDGFHFELDGKDHQLLQINGEDPDAYLLPSLNAAGEPIYRLGTLSYHEPSPLQLLVSGENEIIEMELSLTSSEYHNRDLFNEERIGGIHVISVRSFADFYAEELSAFLKSAVRYKGEPYSILDIRGNGGGSTDWPKNWITRFTGHTPSLKQVLTELVSQTSVIGRANLYSEMLLNYPEAQANSIEATQNQYLARAARFANGKDSPHWSGLRFPGTRFIPNKTTLIVVVDRNVASSGEGLLSYLRGQVENVLVVGENSMGALTFGHISLHQLPNSKLKVYVPIKLNAMLDLEFREEIGFTPDLWLPPDQALNHVVAAVRSGTISSRVEAPAGYFTGSFTPEKTNGLNLFRRSPELIPAAVMLVAFPLAAILFGRQRNFFIVNGVLWILAGVFYCLRFGQSLGYAMIALGAICLAFGIYRRQREMGEVNGD